MEKYLNKEFLLSNKETIIKVAAIIILVVVAFFVFVLGDDDDDDQMVIDTQQQLLTEESAETEENGPEKIIVDVAGAVNSPKVVELPAESRVADAISAAGGLTKDADTSQINQAAFLNDGEKIYIPEIGEEDLSGSGISDSISAEASKIDINTATSEELQTLNGVGPATAEKIISYRSDVGYFKDIDELKNVDGIGDKTFEKLKDYIIV